MIPGDCGDPARDGVVGPSPATERADRDLNGDGVAEWVSTDRRLCGDHGNCRWNIFTSQPEGGCRRYLGTVDAVGIEVLADRGEDGFADLRGWWRLSGGTRYLLQHYRYSAGSYRIAEALICRQEQDDRLLCAEERK